MKNKIDTGKVLVRFSIEESEQLNILIKKLNNELLAKGLSINFISRSQMVRSIVISYIKNEHIKGGKEL